MSLIPFSLALGVLSNDPSEQATNYKTSTPVTIKQNIDGNPLASIYLDEDGETVLPNPIITDGRGIAAFYIESGEYIAEYQDNFQLITSRFSVNTSDHSKLSNINSKGSHDSVYSRLFECVDNILEYAPHKIGNIYTTKGRRFNGDGGGASYIVKSGNLNDGYTKFSLGGDLYIEFLPTGNRVNIEVFGAYGDGVTDDGYFIRAALDYAYETYVSTITFNNKVYKSTIPQLLCGTNYSLEGDPVATIDFTNMDETIYPAAFITMDGAHPRGLTRYNRHAFGGRTGRDTGYPVQLKNLEIEGMNNGTRLYPWDTGSSRSALVGIDNSNGYNGPKKLENVLFTGFKRAFVMGDNSYLIEFAGCVFRHNELAFDADLSGSTNSGENIKFSGCTFGNNKIAVNNILCGINFSLCSFDYNWQIIPMNQVKVGGVAGIVTTFSQCHLECNRNNHPTFPDLIPIYNQSIMHMVNCTIHYGGYTTLFENTDTLKLDQIHFYVQCLDKFFIKDVGNFASTTLTNYSYNASKYFDWALNSNNTFPTGTPMKQSNNTWTVGDGTLTWDTYSTSANWANMQFTITNTVEFKAAYCESVKIPVKGKQIRAAIGVFHQGDSNSYSNRIKFWNAAGELISEKQTDIPVTTVYSSYPTDVIPVPSGASHYSLYFKVAGNTLGNYMKFNVIHVEFL